MRRAQKEGRPRLRARVALYRPKHTSVLTSATSERRENQEMYAEPHCSRDIRSVPGRVGAYSVIET